MFVTFFDTCMVSLAAIFVWRISPYLVFFPWLTIACLDGVYLSSALTKVPYGAWFTLTLSAVLTALFILWRFGKEQQWAAEAADRFPTSHFIKKREDEQLQLTNRYGSGTLATTKGMGVFFDKAGETTPIVFSQFAIKLVAAPEVIILFHLRPLETPSVPPEDRYSVSRLAIPNCYRLIIRHGYMDEVITPDLAPLIYKQVRSFITLSTSTPAPQTATTALESTNDQEPRRRPVTTSPSSTDVDNASILERPPVGPETDSTPHEIANEATQEQVSNATTTEEKTRSDSVSAQLAKLDEAYAHQVLYIIGKEQMRIKVGTGILRRALLHAFLWIRDNTRTKIANLRVQTDRVIEIGFVKDI
jgi:KUP system potassium uptake protein